MSVNTKILGSVSIVSIALGLSLTGVMAADAAGKPQVACLQTPAKMSDGDIKGFMDHPEALLAKNPGGGLPLSDEVRSLAGSSSDALEKLMGLVKTANDSQKSAIAAGLARVVFICGGLGSAPAQDYAALIQTSVASAADPGFASTFQQSSADVSTAAVGPGAGPSAEGGGETTEQSQTQATNNYKYNSESGTKTTSGQYTIGTTNSVGNSEDVVSATTTR